MKKILSLFAVMFFAAAAIMAQTAADYSGKWNLDVKGSELGQRSQVESMTLTVTHTGNDLTVVTATKRESQGGPAQAARGRGPGGGMGPGMMPGDGTVKYVLDGKERTESEDSRVGTIETSLTGRVSGNSLALTSTRTTNSPVGSIKLTTTENWTLSDEGKTLTINREMDTPRGKMNTVMVFRKEQ